MLLLEQDLLHPDFTVPEQMESWHVSDTANSPKTTIRNYTRPSVEKMLACVKDFTVFIQRKQEGCPERQFRANRNTSENRYYPTKSIQARFSTLKGNRNDP